MSKSNNNVAQCIRVYGAPFDIRPWYQKLIAQTNRNTSCLHSASPRSRATQPSALLAHINQCGSLATYPQHLMASRCQQCSVHVLLCLPMMFNRYTSSGPLLAPSAQCCNQMSQISIQTLIVRRKMQLQILPFSPISNQQISEDQLDLQFPPLIGE